MAWEKLAACSKAEASKHILGYYSLLFYCSAQLTHCCILIVSPSINRYVPVSTRVRPVCNTCRGCTHRANPVARTQGTYKGAIAF